MRKILFAAVAALLLVSCGKEDPAKGIVVDQTFTSKATIKGVAHLNTNTSGSTVEQFVPAGTLLVFTVANSEYHPNLVEGSYVKTATVGENGAFEVELPAREDGEKVTVYITGDPILVPIKMADQVDKNQIFEIDGAPSIDIVKGLIYQQKINYIGGEVLLEKADWTEGTYEVNLKYFNGLSAVAADNVDVKVTIDGGDFIPERTNPLTFIAKTDANGKLTIKLDAPSVLEGGLNFRMESNFIKKFNTVVAGTPTALDWVYEMSSVDRVIYGGKTVTDADIIIDASAPIEQENVDYKWKDATYTVKLRYAKDLTAPATLSPIPDDAKVTITTTNRNTLESSFKEITTFKSGSDTNPLEYTFKAPDPAFYANPLTFTIKVDFIAEVVVNAIGDKEFYKFSMIVDSNSIWGDINKKHDDGDNVVIATGAAF